MSWPHMHAGHRGDRRSDARGAARGRIRWTWRAPDGAPATSPLVLGDRIAVVAGDALWVLDPAGAVRSRLAIAGRLGLLAPEGPLVLDGSLVQQLDWTGSVLWQLDVEQTVAAVQRSPVGDIAVCTHERGYPPRGRLVVLDRAGTIRWSFDEHGIPGAVFGAPRLVYDDASDLFTLITGRLGDGVSGDDVPTGGCRGFDASGATSWLGPDHVHEIQGAEHGVLVVGLGTVHGYGRDGALLWEEELDSGPVCTIPGLQLEAVRACTRAALPRILDRRPGGGGTICCGAYDVDDVFYFGRIAWSPPRNESLIALEPDGRLRWHLPLHAVPYATSTPVVGPDATLLLDHGEELIAVE